MGKRRGVHWQDCWGRLKSRAEGEEEKRNKGPHATEWNRGGMKYNSGPAHANRKGKDIHQM